MFGCVSETSTVVGSFGRAGVVGSYISICSFENRGGGSSPTSFLSNTPRNTPGGDEPNLYVAVIHGIFLKRPCFKPNGGQGSTNSC